MRAGYEHYYSLLRFLRKNIAFPYPISIRRVKLPNDRIGDCDFENGKFKIRIDRSLPELLAMDILIHEISHALSWESDKHLTDHGPKWGLAYSKTYRTFLQWLKA